MFKHKFGTNNVKSADELKQVKIATSAKDRAAEVWSTDEVDALRVSILDSDIKKEQKNCDKYSSSQINPFGVYSTQEIPVIDDQVLIDDEQSINDESTTQSAHSLHKIDELKNQLTTAQEPTPVKDADEGSDILVDQIQELIDTEVLSSPVNTSKSKQLVAVYSPNNAFINSVQKELELLGEAWVYCIDGLAGIEGLNSAPELAKIDTWIINLTDDDESDVLDEILDQSADANTMYLSGSALTKTCREKLKEFLQ